MKIGLVCPYHMFIGGGVREHVLAVQEELARLGHDVKIITPLPRDYVGEIPDSIIVLGRSAKVRAFFKTTGQWSVSVDTDAIDEVLEKEQFDVLHFHEPWVPIWSRQLLMRSKAANVATMHARLPDSVTTKTITSIITPYTKSTIKYFDAFTAVSPPAAEFLLSVENVPITIVPNGIDIAKYSKTVTTPAPKIRGAKHKTILYVGRLEKRKGVKYLLRAYGDLAFRRNDVQLLIAGDGPEEEMLKAYCLERNIPRVTFLGHISDKEKIHLLHRADVFSSAARYGESFGIVLLEAMAAELPIVAGDNPGYQSVLKERGLLSLVNPQDSVDFGRRLELLLFDNDMRKLWKNWARTYVKQFAYKEVVEQYLDVYKQAKKHHGHRREEA